MDYSNKQIKQILAIQEFVDMANTLSKIYAEYDDKILTSEVVVEKNKVYKLFCSAMYNLIDAIKNSKYLFENSKSYDSFFEMINKVYYTDDKEYYEKKNYKSTLYKILKEMRNQINHYTKEDCDDIVMFEVYIDFEIVNDIRKTINEMFNEIFSKLDKQKVKKIILSKPKIKYSAEKYDKQINIVEQKYHESTNEIDKLFAKDTENVIKMLKEYGNPSNLIDLALEDKSTIEKYDFIDGEIQRLFYKQYQYILKSGNELQKESMNLLVKFFADNELVTKNKYDKNLENLLNQFKELKEQFDNNK